MGATANYEIEVYVWGARGHGKVVADAARAAGWVIGAFIDADATLPSVLPEQYFLAGLGPGGSNPNIILGIGDNSNRERVFKQAAQAAFPVLRHPTSYLSPDVVVQSATVILAGAIINPGTLLGTGVIVNTRVVIEHDCRVGDFVHISPGAILTGNVTVGARTWIGAGAVVIPGVNIGANAVVGAGAVVIRDVADNSRVVGNPARVIS